MGAQPTYFRDIRADHSNESWWFNFGWLDIDGQLVAVVAEPVDPPVPEGEIGCHACPKFHKYLVYGWNAASGHFELRQTIPPTEKLHDGEDNPLKIASTVIVPTRPTNVEWLYSRSRNLRSHSIRPPFQNTPSAVKPSAL